MNPRLKSIAHMPTVDYGDDSSAGHVSSSTHSSREGSPVFTRSTTTSSVQDEAALLLSIAGICDREVKSTGFAAIFEDDFPRFPPLAVKNSGDPSTALKPRSIPLLTKNLNRNSSRPHDSIRARAVSIDSPALAATSSSRLMDRTSSPLLLGASLSNTQAPALVSPVAPHAIIGSLPPRKQSLRRAKQSKPKITEPMVVDQHLPVSSKDKKGRTLQANPPKGVPIKMIGRKKFSWKCYPELEQFLIANREEYLRHSALNYTVQQKQYNNRLTDQLLDLATKHGYLFDTAEFSFVTVRDRIRCYYKSYVQSAKKRGVLMGYAARKAGLLKDDDLIGNGGRIVKGKACV